uniref:Uncharacterized protein n=1 Tax=Glossina pallidipes TaxID=7398 RepID=A0A1A9ZAG3_GLOPL
MQHECPEAVVLSFNIIAKLLSGLQSVNIYHRKNNRNLCTGYVFTTLPLNSSILFGQRFMPLSVARHYSISKAYLKYQQQIVFMEYISLHFLRLCTIVIVLKENKMRYY